MGLWIESKSKKNKKGVNTNDGLLALTPCKDNKGLSCNFY
ncbi:hypothetical protein C8R26_10350 [Nitrosomonas oligotropha]|uniref:Uncharacterized protein n=1 Tax=Nitrosomonas oligotropha TaxID=42354 RepID=A0A2T5I3E5_9PROT|nr:hypothetical protein C8R26_10350 [Nitrosomonas oligotropha]